MGDSGDHTLLRGCADGGRAEMRSGVRPHTASPHGTHCSMAHIAEQGFPEVLHPQQHSQGGLPHSSHSTEPSDSGSTVRLPGSRSQLLTFVTLRPFCARRRRLTPAGRALRALSPGPARPLPSSRALQGHHGLSLHCPGHRSSQHRYQQSIGASHPVQGRRTPAGHNILFWCGQSHHRSRDENCPGEEGTRLGRRTSRLLRTAGAPQLPDPLRGCGRGGRPRAERSRSRPGREEKQRVDQRRLRAVLSALRHPLRAQLRRRSIPAGLRPLPRAARPERPLGRVVFRSFAWRRAPRGALKAPLCTAAAAVPRSAPAPVNRGALSGNGSGAPQRHRADGGRSAAEPRGRT